MQENAAPGAARSLAAETIEIVKTIVVALLIALVLRVGLFEPFTIPSDSMEPGLRTGDYVVVTKFDYGWSRYSVPLGLPLFSGRVLGEGPRRGDVVVFKLPRDTHQDYIKRVIGLPGDRVQVSAGTVSVNGKPIAQTDAGFTRDPGAPDVTVLQRIEHRPDGRPYTTFDRGPAHDGDDTEVYVVPEGHYFMMGDNRDNSLDSRWPPMATGVGFVPAENLVGQARFVLLSWRGASLWKPWTWANIDFSRILKPVR
ncbi:MAG: signal peptidase I [Alphaproteobacteria bacterium]|nr:signal peptidase I [Alphaproteobacteria bacterium]MBU1516957.1 signal peptidase I [Alphaproteobacteria bacterium]MBU2095845.1 signal peptidase I [Alphaproteobacteria bacterium]MBU2152018.1 signal peptidase I [Alphaproteobacteria bacterium]MBU2309539.1 signal peptidase I [Alphaproteobacteria bacterium]